MTSSWSEIRDFVYQAIGWLVTYSRVARSSASGHDDEVEGRSEPDEPSYQIPVRRLWPFGLRSRPPAGVEALVVHIGGGATRGVMLGAESPKYGPQDLDEGEAALHGATAAVIRIWKDGRITIDGDGADVIVNGGSAKVVRVGDHGDAGTLTITGQIGWTYVDPDGQTTTGVGGAPIALKSKSTEGAARLKA